MSEYRSNATFADLAQRIAASRRTAILGHARPDGDSIGAMLGLGRAMAAAGLDARLYTMGPIEPPLLRIAAPTPLHRLEEQPPDDACDLVIVLDTGAWSQLEPIEAWLRPRRSIAIGIDHHVMGDSDVCSQRLVRPDAASTAQLMVPLLDELGWPLERPVAEPLFVGLATDTGWFKYPSAGEAEFAIAARLLRAGVDKTRLYQIIEETYRPQRLAIEARALASLDYPCGGAVAVMSLLHQDFRDTGAVIEDLTGIVNDPMVVGRVRLSILLCEIEKGRTKISFRSKAAIDAGPEIDVNLLAQRFGGGGHRLAAGARVQMPLAAARTRVLDEVQAMLAGHTRAIHSPA